MIVYIFGNIYSILSSIIRLVTQFYTLITLKLVKNVELIDV